MSFDVTKSPEYNKINQADLGQVNIAKSPQAQSDQKTIARVAQGVIQHLQSTAKIDADSIAHFISNVEQLNEQFKAEGLGSPFATSVTVLRTLLALRQNFPEGKLSTLINHPFVTKLVELSGAISIKNKQGEVAHLDQFLVQCLNPMLLTVGSSKELQALQPIVAQCHALYELIKDADPKGELAKHDALMINSYEWGRFRYHPFYQKMLSYQPGMIQGLESKEIRQQLIEELSTRLHAFYSFVAQGLIHAQDQKKMYIGVLTLQQELQKYGAGELLDPLVQEMRSKLNMPTKQQEKEPVVVKQTYKASKEQLIDRVQSQLKVLDMHGQKFKEKVQDILTDLNKLKQLDPQLKIASLERALQLLIDPKPLAITPEELRFVQFLSKKYASIVNKSADYSLLGKPTVQEALSKLARELKQNTKAFHQLDQVCQKFLKDLQEKVVQDRLTRFVSESGLSKVVMPERMVHFSAIVDVFHAIHDVVHQHITSKWNEILAVYNQKTDGKFSALLAHYRMLDPCSNMEGYIQMCQEKFFEALDFAEMGEMQKGEVLSYLQERANVFVRDEITQFLAYYEKNHKARHMWLVENLKHIKRSYNQRDPNTNLGEGVCYNNSLFRCAQIIQNPQISDEEILLGSSQQTRYFQNFGKRLYQAYMDNQIPAQEIRAGLEKIVTSYGLQRDRHSIGPIQVRANEPSSYVPFVQSIEKKRLEGFSNMTIRLRKPAGNGHMVNIAYNQQRGVYRLMDDNLGLAEFENSQVMQKELAAYFRIFYPAYTEYSLETYSAINN